MAIVKMTKAIVACPSNLKETLLESLQNIGLYQIRQFEGLSKNEADNIETKNLTSLGLEALSILERYFKKRKPFVANFAWPRPILNQLDYKTCLDKVDLKQYCEKVVYLGKQLSTTDDQIISIKQENVILSKFIKLDIPTKLPNLYKVSLKMGLVPKRKLKDLSDFFSSNHLAFEILFDNIVLFAATREGLAELEAILNKLNFEPLPFTLSDRRPKDAIRANEVEIIDLEKKRDILSYDLKILDKLRLSLMAHLDELKTDLLANSIQSNGLFTSHICAFVGYIPDNNKGIFIAKLKEKAPQAVVTFHDVPEDEEPPILLENNPYSRSFEMVTTMYGLPSYHGFDSTPIVSVLFPLFFGLCFGDVIYGLLLMFISLWYLKIFKNESKAKKFFWVFIWCSIYTIVVGALTGSWGGNLIGSEGNIISWSPLVSLKDTLMIINPIKETITFFVLTLIIGIGSQFLGIFLAAWTNIKNGNVFDAIVDQGGWLLFLSGLVLFAIDFVGSGISHLLKIIMFVLIVIGAMILVFFQGRSTKNLLGRFGMGLLSLYGIVGGYGATSFLGDIMSYSRLMALGLTTSLVAIAFNKMAQMVGLSGFILPFGLLVLFVGHTLNFFLNVIGSFVHPARLTFLEFYGRFYSVGGKPFKPFAKIRDNINVLEDTP